MDTMTKRERVEAALNLQETDRPPLYDILVNDAVIRHVAGGTPEPTEEWWQRRMTAAAALLDMTRAVGGRPQPPGETRTPDGFVHYRNDFWISGGIRERPFSEVKGAAKWLGGRLEALRQPLDLEAAKISSTRSWEANRRALGDDTVVIHEFGTGLDDLRYALGFELFSYLAADRPQLIGEYLELSTERSVATIHATADRDRSPCALPYGDIAAKNMLLHSPAWLRREFFPRLKRLCDALHEHDVKCLFHSDGYLMDVMDDLLDAGIDGLNPIETVAGMDLAEVKRKYGDRLFLTGAVDLSQLLANGTPEEVRAAVRRNVEVASPGYFPGSTTELDNGATLENALAMFEAVLGHPAPILANVT